MRAAELRDLVLVEARAAGPLPAGLLARGEVQIERYTPDEIILSLRPNGDSVLVIANTWNPYWKAEVDGAPAKVVRANYAQLAVAIRAGQRQVRLWYEPPYAPQAIAARLGQFFSTQ